MHNKEINNTHCMQPVQTSIYTGMNNPWSNIVVHEYNPYTHIQHIENLKLSRINC